MHDTQTNNALRLGQLLLDSQKITPADAEKILRLQKAENLRFGDAAIQLGLVTENDIRRALAHQFEYPYLAPGEGGFSSEIIAAYDPFSAEVEQIRSLRSQLILRWFTLGHKTLALVTDLSDNSASHLTANLAVVFSQMGENTLLIDANLRESRQHKLFNLGNRAGLSDILAGRADMSATVRLNQLRGLSLLTAGTTPPNPVELLSQTGFANLLEQYSQQYDVILVDSPPGMFSEASLVCSRVGGTLLTASKDVSRISDLQKMILTLGENGASIIGTVLTDFPDRR